MYYHYLRKSKLQSHFVVTRVRSVNEKFPNLEVMHQALLISLTVIQCVTHTYGQHSDIFLAKHRNAIEAYIMTGYGDGWKHCDLLSVGSTYQSPPGDTANFQMDSKTLGTFDISSSFSSSYCLIVRIRVNDTRTLAAIIEFGWTAIQHKRLGMVMTLENNMTLEGLKNISKLPFVIAAQFNNDKEKFLCPVVGKLDPVVKSFMCPQSFTGYKGKYIRVTTYPYSKPYGKSYDKDGKGIDTNFLQLLQNKMKFEANFTPSNVMKFFDQVALKIEI